jgi:hypothetical protein
MLTLTTPVLNIPPPKGRHVDEATFVRVYRSVDALVIPTHGEGWGRPQMEVGALRALGAGGDVSDLSRLHHQRI